MANNPAALGQKNITTAITLEEFAELTKLLGLSGCKQGPYMRALLRWAIANQVLVRPIPAQQEALIAAIKNGTSPLPLVENEVFIQGGQETERATSSVHGLDSIAKNTPRIVEGGGSLRVNEDESRLPTRVGDTKFRRMVKDATKPKSST